MRYQDPNQLDLFIAETSKPHMSHAWLTEQYINRQLSFDRIAALAGVGHSTIEYWLKKHQIPRRCKIDLVIARNKAGEHLHLDSQTLATVKQFHEQGLTQGEIAAHFGVRKEALRRHIRLLGLRGYPGHHRQEFRSSYRAEQLADIIQRLYVEEGLTSVEIGAKLGLDYSTIIVYARHLGIPIKTRSQAASKRRGSVSVSGELREILDGELLGDGCLSSPHEGSAFVCYGTTRQCYMAWLAERLQIYGLEPSGIPVKTYERKLYPGRPIFHYTSKRYPELYDLYQRWYPEGKKRVPHDVVLTPTVCRHWYIGDGSVNRPFPNPYITISTQAFPRDDVEWLRDMLSVHVPGVKIGKHPNGAVIIMRAKAALSFLDYIGPCPEPIRAVYGYKWGTDPKPWMVEKPKA